MTIIYLVWYICICIFLLLQYIFILWTSYFNNSDIIFYPMCYISLHISTYEITLFLYIVSLIKFNCYYILKNIITIILYHKFVFVLIKWNHYASVGLSHVLFWSHPPQNDLILVISPLYKYLWHYYVLNTGSQNIK